MTNLFFLLVRVISYKKSRPAQCFSCQKFDHLSQNCGDPFRYVKCCSYYKVKACPKNFEKPPHCVNYGKQHTAEYYGCKYYLHIKDIVTEKHVAHKHLIPLNSTKASV